MRCSQHSLARRLEEKVLIEVDVHWMQRGVTFLKRRVQRRSSVQLCDCCCENGFDRGSLLSATPLPDGAVLTSSMTCVACSLTL